LRDSRAADGANGSYSSIPDGVGANAHSESAQSRTPEPTDGRHPHNGMRGAAVMTPDTSEGRERIARLEGQVDDVERQVQRNERTFGPLPLAVERLQWTIDAINTRLDKRDREDDARFEKLTRSFENQIAACSSAVAEANSGLRELAEAEHERRKREQEYERQLTQEQESATQRFVARYGMTAVLGAALIGAITSILVAFLGGS